MAENWLCLSGDFYLFCEIGVRSSAEMSSEGTGRVLYVCMYVCMQSFIHSFIQQRFIGHLLCARHWLEYKTPINEQNKDPRNCGAPIPLWGCYRVDPEVMGSLCHCGFFARHQGIGIMALKARVW